jgi:hypothetical protein
MISGWVSLARKQWCHDELACKDQESLSSFFEEQPTLHLYLEDIASCNYVIAGDT